MSNTISAGDIELNYRISDEVREAISRAIFLTGSTRSGTTIMGKLFASLLDFEMSHEPPLTYLMIPMINDLAEETWRILFETYLFEDNLMLAIPGRRLNFNKEDESSIFASKTKEEIEDRTAKTMRRTEILPIALKRRFGFKMPEMLPFLPKFKSYYPEMTTIVMLRKPAGVVASIRERQWYSDEALRNATGEWLFRKDTELSVPYWVPTEFVERWIDMSELERCCFCYSIQYRNIVGRDDCMVVDYDDFVTNPRAKFNALASMIGCEFGPLTEKLLDSVAEPEKDRNIPFEEVRSEFTEPVEEAYAACRDMAIAL